MKRTWIVIAAICAALGFTACSKPADNDKMTVPESVETSAVEEPGPGESTALASQEAPGNTAEFKILMAKVTEVSDTLKDVTVKNGDNEITLDLDGVVVETSYALDLGADVSVIYKGEISGTDISNAKIVLVLDAQDNMEVKQISGTVEDQAMSSFTIRTEAGRDMGFVKDNCEGLDSGVLGQAKDDSNGSGVKVKITYVTVNYDAGSESNFPLKVEAVE